MLWIKAFHIVFVASWFAGLFYLLMGLFGATLTAVLLALPKELVWAIAGFALLGTIGIPTHFIRRLNMREQLVRQVEIVPIEVVVRNVAAGSISKRLGIEEGTQLPRTIIEYYYKDDALGDPMIAEEHIACFGWASR